MEQPVEIHYQCTREDYAEAQSAFNPSWSGVPALVMLVLGVVALISSFLTTAPPEGAPDDSVSTSPLLGHLLWIAAIVAFWIIVFRRLLRPHAKPRAYIVWMLRIAAATVWLGIFIGAAARLFPDGGHSAVGWLASIVFVLPFLLLLPLFTRFLSKLSARGQWTSVEHLHRPETLVASGTGLTISTPVMRYEYRWEAFRSFHETRNLIVLKIATMAFTMVPKRAFASPEHIAQFISLLQTNIAPAANTPPIPAPPPRRATIPTAALLAPPPASAPDARQP